jgi:phage tail sheath protein FI
MKTPGVYIQELNAFGNAVVPVPTAVPAFIGYTAKTSFNGKSILNKAVKVTSLSEFLLIFGNEAPQVQYNIISTLQTEESKGNKPKKHGDFTSNGYTYSIAPTTINYRMYSSIKFFYENGGETCYIMSIGTYDYSKSAITDTTDFINAITLLKKETEPTILVIPDAVEIIDPTADSTSSTYLRDKYANAYSLQNAMINHCGEMTNRIAILDIPGGYSEPLVGTKNFEQFRNSIEPLESKFNSYAAAYYPWLHTTVYQSSEISYKNIDKKAYSQVIQLLSHEFTNAKGEINSDMAKLISAFDAKTTISLDKADLTLQNLSTSYQLLMGSIMAQMNLIAPSAGMAGIYTSVDNNEGVWVAPANVAIQSTISPAIKIDYATQEDLNVPINGKSICAIRAFTGRGNLVWGARTLDGNSNDWRYINIRRTMIYIEQSIKDAARAYVFAPNDASTWVNVKSMISNFLTGLWKQGGLVGPRPADAFSVSVGLGSTMTGDDILNGIMRISVKVAVSHPAEFIVITFQQEMQNS